MRRDMVGTAILIFAVVFIVLGTMFVKWPDFQHKADLAKVRQSASVLDVRLTIRYDKPPIYEERYAMRNDNGVSTARYTITGYSGKMISITLPPTKNYAVTFFFEEVVQDGIWELTNRPPRGNTDAHYALFVHQAADNRQGSRTILFTDPHYWALTAGRQYEMHLSKNGPTPDLLKLQSTSTADPRYQKIVAAFRTFGSSSFRKKVAQAQQIVRQSR